MPKGPQAYPGQRIDLDDYTAAARTYAKELVAQGVDLVVLDQQSRIRRGFRVELPDQTTYPGRIVVHGGDAYDADGVQLFNEDQLTVSRTITLEGTSTTFYVEIQYVEGDGNVDARGFWDPTVDQGADVSGDELPDGQEFSDNIATTKVPDWKIVTPISTSAFARDADPTSTKIPLIKLTTDGSNEINSSGTPGLATDKPATTILEVISTTVLRVQDAQLFPNSSDVTVGVGAAGEENATITTSVPSTNLITLSAPLGNTHYAGEIFKGRLTTSLDLINEDDYGRYYRGIATNPIDWKDQLFQGDEVHGGILSEGHDASVSFQDQSSDVNLQSMKDHIDFLAAQIQEMKWGHRNPYVADAATDRTPPGLTNDIPAVPRYFNKSGGIQGARTATVTVGDAGSSWGDFNGADEVSIQAAIDNLPSSGGEVVLKAGAYTLFNDLVINKPVLIRASGAVVVWTQGGLIDVVLGTAGNVSFKNLLIARSTTDSGIEISTTSATASFAMEDCILRDVSLDVAASLPKSTFITRCTFESVAALAARALIRTTAAGADIGGVFDSCSFNHVTGTSLAGGVTVDASLSTAGLVNASFVGCEFSTTAASNASDVDCGSAPENVRFTRCGFSATAVLSNGHIRFEGTNLIVDKCMVKDTLSRLVDGYLAVQVLVDGVTQDAASAGDLVRVVGCDDVTVQNCKAQLIGATELTQCLIRVGGTVGIMRRISIVNNTLESTSDHGTGVIFDCGNADMYDVQIVNNNFKNMEVGVYLNSSVGAKQYYSLNIEGNTFSDRGVSDTAASYQDLGILSVADAQLYQASFINNKFINLNPANATAVATRTRAAIDLQSTINIDITISGNQVTNVGDSANPNHKVAAFRCAALTRAVIADNIVNGVDGENAYGMILSESTNHAFEVVCKGNILRSIVTGTGGSEVWGINGTNLDNVTFTSNTFDILTMSGTAASKFGCIGSNTNTAVFDEISIVGNSVSVSDTDVSFVVGNVGNSRKVAITNNIVEGGAGGDIGILLAVASGGTLANVTITGNNIVNFLDGILIDNNGTTGERLAVANNTILFNGTGTNYGIFIEACNLFTITGNFVMTAGDETQLKLSTCTRFSVSGNVLEFSGTLGTHYNLDMGASCSDYVVVGNIFDSNGDNVAVPINETNAASGGIISNNMYDSTAGGTWAPTSSSVWGTDDYAVINGGSITIGMQY